MMPFRNLPGPSLDQHRPPPVPKHRSRSFSSIQNSVIYLDEDNLENDESCIALDETRPLNGSPVLDKTVPLFRSPIKGNNSLSIFSPEKPLPRSPLAAKNQNGLDTSADLFASSQEDTEDDSDVLWEDETPSTSKSRCSPIAVVKSKNEAIGNAAKQVTIDRFVSKSSSHARKQNSQLRIELFLKWKDPNKAQKIDAERVKSFARSKRKPTKSSDSSRDPDPVSEYTRTPANIASPPPKRSSNEAINKPSSSRIVITPSKAKNILQKSQSSPDLGGRGRSKRTVEETDRDNWFKKFLNEEKKFKEEHLKGNLKQIQDKKKGALKDGVVVRKRVDRERMHGTDCPCCADYYNALDLSPASKEKRINQISRHRYVELPRPKTPENYWEIGFPSSSEQKRRGYIKIASKSRDSPVAKRLF